MMSRLFIMMFALALGACNLPPIPLFGGGPEPDVDVPEDSDNTFVVCDPSSRRCIGNSVRVCSPDGRDFSIEACDTGETCSDAACEPIANTCSTEQPFALTATELAFEVSRDFKSQTKQVRLTNCGTGPIIVRDSVVRGPSRPDGTPVFQLDGSFAQARIPAGESLNIKVTYRPVPGLSQVTGRLELSLVVGELTNVEVALRSKAICATATPYIDLGMRNIGVMAIGDGIVQNCGSEPLTVTGWHGPQTFEVEFGEELPFTLAPGQELDFEVATMAEAPALLDGNIDITFTDPLLRPTVKVRGIAVLPECVPATFSEPQILANNQARPPHPGSLVRIRFPDGDPLIYHWLENLGQPQGSNERLNRSSDGWTTRPRMVGRYRATLRGYDLPSGSRSCELDTIDFEVYPPDDSLHVELSWVSEGDGIVEDLGFGHSMNLDLHVLSTSSGDGTWNTVESDCFPGVIGPCGEGRGVVSISQGGLPEFVQFSDPTGLKFEVGVYVSNTFNFDAVLTQVRVYRGRQLVAELHSDSLQNANDFWLVGRWDEETGEWTEINSVFSGFPL